MSRSHIPSSDVISVGFDGHVATVWLDRPEKRNALAPDFWEDFPMIMRALSADNETRAIVIAAKGQSFTVGIDLKAFGPTLMGGDSSQVSGHEPGSDVGRRMALYRKVKELQATFNAIAECSKPVIAAVHGHCIGAGIDLITACDIRYTAADAVFSVRETKIAMVADVGTMQRLPKIINPGYVAEVVYTGKDFGATEAHTMGLVTRVVLDADAVVAEAQATAHNIAANSPLAVQGTKAVLAGGENRSIEEALDYVALWNAAFIQSNDFTEAITSFIQKRSPEFTGE
ncbi:MAG: crotonase/enoyl-CoA hydratase family protein [Actinomycetia bacterium]|nr:crotonase/enoyl-CoA hydratase family protein [Actinomycetes bacterium]